MDHKFRVVHFEPQRTGNHIANLFTLVLVFGNDGALLQIDSGQHLLCAGNDLSRDKVVKFLFRHAIPFVDFHHRPRLQSPKSKVESPKSKVEGRALDFGPWTLDFRLWTIDIRLSTLDFGL